PESALAALSLGHRFARDLSGVLPDGADQRRQRELGPHPLPDRHVKHGGAEAGAGEGQAPEWARALPEVASAPGLPSPGARPAPGLPPPRARPAQGFAGPPGSSDPGLIGAAGDIYATASPSRRCVCAAAAP